MILKLNIKNIIHILQIPVFKATPHIRQNKKVLYNENMNKQMTLSYLYDELAQTKTIKKSFLKQIVQDNTMGQVDMDN